MKGAFAGCSNMEHRYLDYPNTETVQDFSFMFLSNHKFNRDIRFKVYNGLTTESMFEDCIIFNQKLNSASGLPEFNTRYVRNMKRMFYGCYNFKQSLESYIISNVTTMEDILAPDQDLNTVGSTANYDNTLFIWANDQLQKDVVANFGVSKYSSNVQSNRNAIIGRNNWTITDGGLQV